MLAMLTAGTLKHLTRGSIMYGNDWARILVVRMNVFFGETESTTK